MAQNIQLNTVMASYVDPLLNCGFCKKESAELKKCTNCEKVSYCNKECQRGDWKKHKPSCRPYIVREVPGKGRGVFATRKINPGMVIMEETPLIILDMNESVKTCRGIPFDGPMFLKLKSQISKMNEKTKDEVLNLYDPSGNIEALESDKNFDDYITNNTNLSLLKTCNSDDNLSKILRIFIGNCIILCERTKNTKESGLYNDISRINHSCSPNAQWSWVKEDISRKQVRAMKTIEKGDEITVYYIRNDFGSREKRCKGLLLQFGMWCSCSECSLQGEALKENEKMRKEIRKSRDKIYQMLYEDVETDLTEKDVGVLVSLDRKMMELVKKLDIPHDIFYNLLTISLPVACYASISSVPGAQSPDEVKSEAWKLCQNSGDQFKSDYEDLVSKHSQILQCEVSYTS